MPQRPQTFKPARAGAPRYQAADARGTTAERGYDARWKRFRLWYLSRHPLCVTPGCGRIAVVVDHVVPKSVGGAHCDEANSQALCKHCHDVKTNEDKKRYGTQLGSTYLTDSMGRGEGG